MIKMTRNKITITIKTMLISLLLSSMTFAQTLQSQVLTKEEAYSIYSSLVGGKWVTKGKWQSGAEYHQEIVVEMELTKNIFTVKTCDYIDSKQFENAQRNFGVRAWDEKEHKMKFWEFDVFGGITEGEIRFDGRNIYHIYQYTNKKGNTITLADAWIYVDNDTYIFKVCEFNNGMPGKEYMTSTYKRT
jgi:hypothetical protein